jgi:hypothetical protein
VRHLLFCLAALCSAYGDSSWENVLANAGNGTLYVSLGPDCLPAGMIRHFGKRQAAFPFDWLLSLDNLGFLQVLTDDFKHFTNPECLIQHPVNGLSIVHKDYHLDFCHDWHGSCWENGELFNEYLVKMNSQYEKRIGRFRKLQDYTGQVVFIRALCPSYNYAYLHPEVCWGWDSSIDEKDYSLKLFEVLKTTFPKLDFKLLIIQKSKENNYFEFLGHCTIFYMVNIEEHVNWELLFN